MDALLVPSSIQRIRSFLVEMCGMKVKPWASTEETLAALHTTLVARHRCGIFWDSLRTLLEQLAHDMKTRASAVPGTLVENEILDGKRTAHLLDEIRQSLARQESESPGSFRQLSAALSAPALGLLLLLGSVASVGCDHSGLKQRGDAGVPDSNRILSPKGGPPPSTDGGTVWLLDANPATPLDNRPDAPRLILKPPPDTAPGRDAVAHGPDGAAVTIQDIMDSCNVPKADQDAVLACLARLRDSWTTGVAQTLAGTPCTYVNEQLQCFTAGLLCGSGSSEEFVVGASRVCRPIYIYAGVRFV